MLLISGADMQKILKTIGLGLFLSVQSGLTLADVEKWQLIGSAANGYEWYVDGQRRWYPYNNDDSLRLIDMKMKLNGEIYYPKVLIRCDGKTKGYKYLKFYNQKGEEDARVSHEWRYPAQNDIMQHLITPICASPAYKES